MSTIPTGTNPGTTPANEGAFSFSIESQVHQPVEVTNPDPNAPNPAAPVTTPTPTPDNPNPEPIARTPELAKELGGATFDRNGNLISNVGKLLKSAFTVEQELEARKVAANPPAPVTDPKVEEPVEEKLSFDNDGNVVNEKGEIVHAKGSFTYDEKTGTVTPVEEALVQSLAEKARNLGYVLMDDQGQPLTFEDTEDGYLALAERMAEERYAQRIEAYQSSHREVISLANHIAKGGDPYEYFNQKVNTVDYTKVSLPVEDKDGRANIVKQYLTKVGAMDDATASEIVQSYKDAGKIDEKYQDFLGKLQVHQKNQMDQEAANYAAQLAAQEKEVEDYWNGVKQVITTGKLSSIELPAKDRDQFFNYLAVPVGNTGKSQYQIDFDSLTPQQQLETMYLVYKRLNIDELVKVKAQAEKVDAIKSRAMRSKAVVLNGNTGFHAQPQNQGYSNLPDMSSIV